VGESGKPKKACTLCFHGAIVRFQDCMLQDEVVRTWSGDFQKSSQHQKIKQLNSRETCVWGRLLAPGF